MVKKIAFNFGHFVAIKLQKAFNDFVFKKHVSILFTNYFFLSNIITQVNKNELIEITSHSFKNCPGRSLISRIVFIYILAP